jgi:tetratricopeptide (TPR) repeat protein
MQIKGEYKMALEYFEQAYRLEPTVQVMNAFAYCAFQAKNYKLALNLYKNLNVLQPEKTGIKNNLMICLMECGEYLQALRIAKELLEQNPKSIDLRKNISRLYRLIGQWEYSIEILNSLLKQGKVDAEIFWEKGICEMHVQEYEAARNSLRKAVQMSPEDPLLHKDLGLLYLYMNLSDFAKEELQRALELAPNSPDTVFAWGTFLNANQDFEQAQEYYLKALKKDRENFSYLTSLGLNYLALNDIKNAGKYLKKAYKINPKDVETSWGLANIYYKQEKYTLARDILTDIWKTPNNADIVNLLAMCYMKLKDYKKAIKIYEKLLEMYPKNHLVLTSLAQGYFEIKDFKNAKKYATEALTIFSDFEDALEILDKIKEEKKNGK